MSVRRRRVLATMVAVAVLGFASPLLRDVYRETGGVLSLSPGWLVAIVLAEVSQLVAVWCLFRVLLGTDRWFDVAAPQLAGDAASNLVPGASLSGAGLQLSMLARAGFPATRVTTAFAAISVLTTIPGFIVMPLIVLVGTTLGSEVDPRFVGPMWMAIGVLSGLLIALLVVARRDRPWLLIASAVAGILRAVRRRTDADDLGRRLLSERDAIGGLLRDRAPLLSVVALCRSAGDFLGLYFALRAVGVTMSLTTALAVFIVGDIAGRIPLTPGGLGFVEAGLTGALSIAGVPTEPALLALVVYRLAATWMPSAAGLGALVLFERRHASRTLDREPTPAVDQQAPLEDVRTRLVDDSSLPHGQRLDVDDLTEPIRHGGGLDE